MQPTEFKTRLRLKRMIAVGLILLTGGGIAFFAGRGSEPRRQIRDAEHAFDRGEFATSLQLAEQVLTRHPHHAEAAMLAGKSAMRLERPQEAVGFFDRVSQAGEADFIAARCESGDLLLLKLYRLSDAERRFRDALAVDPDNTIAIDRLAYILGLTSRYFEQVPLRLRSIRAGKIDAVHLHSLAMAENALENPDDILPYHRAAPDDAAPLITLGRLALQKEEFERARELFERAVHLQPELIEARSRLGELLFEHASEADFVAWYSRLPSAADGHPGIWILRGRWAAKQAANRVAVRCYGEALRLNSVDPRANYQLGRLLLALRREPEAKPFLDRAALIRRYVSKAKVAWRIPYSQARSADAWQPVREAADVAEALGLFWEASAWSRLALDRNPAFSWARERLQRLRPRLVSLPLTRVAPGEDPIQGFALQDYPLPEGRESRVERRGPESGGAPTTGPRPSVTFVDDAAKAGLVFQYFNGQKSQDRGISRMYQFSGGGVAVLDYDRDGLPDVYFAQGCEWRDGQGSQGVESGKSRVEHKDQSAQRSDSRLSTLQSPLSQSGLRPTYTDRLFRNLGNGKFADVTAEAGIEETGFSQGVTVGDFDADGWPDLLVANIGGNRLYRNNADGTFRDVTPQAGIAGHHWTTSCLMADLNGDGLPDICAVNYVTGSNVFTTRCRGGGGGPGSVRHTPSPRNRTSFISIKETVDFATSRRRAASSRRTERGWGSSRRISTAAAVWDCSSRTTRRRISTSSTWRRSRRGAGGSGKPDCRAASRSASRAGRSRGWELPQGTLTATDSWTCSSQTSTTSRTRFTVSRVRICSSTTHAGPDWLIPVWRWWGSGPSFWTEV
jgi:tetratricopeptide (TPR) repeat protein